MVEWGHDVVGIDEDGRRVNLLASATPPFFEPGRRRHSRQQRLLGNCPSQAASPTRGYQGTFWHCIPQNQRRYAADIIHVDAAFESLLPYLSDRNLVVVNSAVPVGWVR